MKYLILFDKTCQDSTMKTYNFLTKRGTTTYVGTNCIVIGIQSLNDIAQAILRTLKTEPKIDFIILDGHGLSGCLCTGSNDVAFSSPKATNLSMEGLTPVDDKLSVHPVSRPLQKVASELGKDADPKNNPVIFLAGCNVAYQQHGRNFIELLSERIFTKCRVMASHDYVVLEYDPKSKKGGYEAGPSSRTLRPITSSHIFMAANGKKVNLPPDTELKKLTQIQF